jgi:hypothetical protein
MSVADKTVKKSGGLGETVSVIVQALLLALVIRTFLFQPFSIPVRLDASDAARGRLPVRHQMGLRLFALFAAVLAERSFPAASGARSRSAATSSCSSSRQIRRSTTSSASSACPATASR